MKRKLPKLTILANTLLIVSVLVQVGYLGYKFYQGTQFNAGHDYVNQFMDIFGLEMYMLIGSIASPLVFVDLFSSQAKGRLSGVMTGTILMLGLLIYKHWSTIRNLIAGQPLTHLALFELGMGLVIPAIIILSILTSNRLLAYFGAIGAIASTVHNLRVLYALNSVMGQQAVSVIRISEILYGLGLFLGLIGVQKINKNSDSLSDSKAKNA